MKTGAGLTPQQQKLYRIAFALAVFTILYNIAEGIIATWLGYEDESLALFGFGADSFIEVISGIGIAHMVIRIRRNPNSNRDPFERTALRITGFSFFALVAGLTATSLYHIWTDHRPETTFWGIVVSAISILVMVGLMMAKTKTGRLLNSDAILADARCTRVCVIMSVILLLSSGIYELTGLPYIDSIGTLALAYYAYGEGVECFEKARNNRHCGC